MEVSTFTIAEILKQKGISINFVLYGKDKSKNPELTKSDIKDKVDKSIKTYQNEHKTSENIDKKI